MRIVALLALCALCAACPSTGIVCQPGTDRCGQGCADYQSDRRNCGACGKACFAGQVCSEGGCVCQAGTTLCGGQCAVLQNDISHCGACGNACASGQVCEKGSCRNACTDATLTQCSGGCVNVAQDLSHCGACGNACESGQHCSAGHCAYDVVAACFTSGQVVGLQADTGLKGPLQPLGTRPAALGALGDSLLALDGIDRRLNQATLYTTLASPALTERPVFNRVGAVPNHVLVDGEWVYVVNAETATLQVLKVVSGSCLGADGGCEGGFDGGASLVTVGELSFGTNTYPQAVAKTGANTLWVPLYGGIGATAAAAGQKLVKVDVSNRAAPMAVSTIDLSTVDLRPTSMGAPAAARPYAITAVGNTLYVALNNLDPDTYQPSGPGIVLEVATDTMQLLPHYLTNCLNPQWVAPWAGGIAVSCAGRAVYSPPEYSLTAVQQAGAGWLLADGGFVVWESRACGGTLPDGGAQCPLILPSRFAVRGSQLFLGDQNAGRVFVLEARDGGIEERRGYFGDAGAPIQACGRSATTGIANVSDLLVVP